MVPGCTHYIITKDDDIGETCQLLNKTVLKSDAVENGNDKMSCGLLPVQWHDYNWAVSCNFRGDEYEEESLSLKDCVSKCNSSRECSHYTWELLSKNTSICKMMSGHIDKSNASFASNPYLVCGVKGKTKTDIKKLPEIGNYFIFSL